MAPMHSIDLDLQTRQILLKAAADTIRHGIATGQAPASVGPETLDPRLHRHEATFVTLKNNGKLRGCIGTLQAKRTLLDDVVFNAFAAAFCDPRFRAVDSNDVDNLQISVSLLGPRAAMSVRSEAELIRQLNVGIDGLILEEDGGISATFLPAVWESLPRPEDFVIQLKRKAGIRDAYWSDTIRFYRYRTFTFSNFPAE